MRNIRIANGKTRIQNKCNNTKPSWKDQAFKNFLMDITMMNRYTKLRKEMDLRVSQTMERKSRPNKIWIRLLDLPTARLSVGKSPRILPQWVAIRTHSNSISSNKETDETGGHRRVLTTMLVPLITIHRTNGNHLIQVPTPTKTERLNTKFRTTLRCTGLKCLERLLLPISTVHTTGKLQRIHRKDRSLTLARTICTPRTTTVCSCIRVIFRYLNRRVKVSTDTIRATSSSSTTIGNQMNSRAFEPKVSKLIHSVH